MADLTVMTLLVICGLLVLRVRKNYDATSVVRRIFFPYAHENVVKKWIDKELSHVVVDANFTEGALELIKDKSEKEFAVLITLDHIFVGSRKGALSLPSAKIRLGVPKPSEDFVKVHSNAGISVLVEREIYEVLKQEKTRLIVATSGLWKFKKLELRPELSWLLYSRRLRQLGPP